MTKVTRQGAGFSQLITGAQVSVDPSGRTINIHVASLAAPERVLAANYVYVRRRDEDIALHFGQLDLAGKALTALLTIEMSAAVGSELIKGAPDLFQLAIDSAGTSPQVTQNADTRTVLERARIVSITVSDDGETSARFYRLSPADLEMVKRGLRAPYVYPVIEVIMPRYLCMSMLKQIMNLVGT